MLQDPPAVLHKVCPAGKLNAAIKQANKAIGIAETRTAIQKGKIDSAPGRDELTYECLQLLDETGLQHLTDLFNACFEAGKTPREWRSAEVKMLFKLNPVTNRAATKSVNNYRGISLLSCVGKTYERILRARIAHHVEHDAV